MLGQLEIGVFVKLLLTVTNLGLLLPLQFAGVAQLVEHFLAKEDVESSSLFARSILRKRPVMSQGVFLCPKASISRGLQSAEF